MFNFVSTSYLRAINIRSKIVIFLIYIYNYDEPCGVYD